MPETWVSDFMAMCCGLSLAIALGWSVTAGAADWRLLAENLCIVRVAGTNVAAERACEIAAARSAATPDYALAFVP